MLSSRILFRILFSVILLLLVSGMMAQVKESLIRTFPASCENVCNGSAEYMDFKIIPERYYYWMSYDEGLYHPMNDAILDGLCAGKYRIREVDILYNDLHSRDFIDESMTDYEGVCTIELSSLGKQEISVYVQFDIEVNYLNYYMHSTYSTDGGLTWKISSQFHQKIITDKSGDQNIYYLLNLPKSASNLEQVMIRLYRRKKDEYNDPPQMQVRNVSMESKRISESVFEIGIQQALHIQSTVSNETSGSDGYIRLNLLGGTAPYAIRWDDGGMESERSGLGAGKYKVEVTDKRNCRQSADFVILPPSGASVNGNFRLERISTKGLYRLKIEGLYRQPLDLIITKSDTSAVKKFSINPLYNDLSMDLDLSFLSSGAYCATLSTSGFSKKTDIYID